MISVIIPTYNDSYGLKTTVDSLLAQDYTKNYEIIVCDNGSSEEHLNLLLELEKNNSEVSLIQELDERSSYAARNKGIMRAQGEIICFLDSDEWVKKTFLTRVEQYFNLYLNISYVGFRVDVIAGKKKTVVAKYNCTTGFPVEDYLSKDNYTCTCALAVRKKIFDELGLFESCLISGGDKEFGQRVFAAGYTQNYADDIVVFHPARYSWSMIIGKNNRIAKGLAQMRLQPHIRKKPVTNLANYCKDKNPVSEYYKNKSRASRRGLCLNFTENVLFILIDYISKIHIFVVYLIQCIVITLAVVLRKKGCD